ncbi:type II toxin-antitoxin system RelE/ParE family toxin [Bradyrhizobium sp. STM 3557]|uniref:type II toxin-antitoxin system RelE/ParE family toxin n=1 Tax=Bradyrhizobium sp. STM 3557 TaxID=578920 RepID=UPI00388E2FBA
MKLVFDDQALADIENIYSWISQDSPSAAKTVVNRLFSSIELLISFPLIGHAGRGPGRPNGSCRDFPISWSMRSIGRLSRS